MPFCHGFSPNSAATWGCIILGLIVALVAGYKAIVQDQARRQLVVVLGAAGLAVVSPFILGLGNSAGMWTSIVLGPVMVILAAKDLYERRTA